MLGSHSRQGIEGAGIPGGCSLPEKRLSLTTTWEPGRRAAAVAESSPRGSEGERESTRVNRG